MFRSRKAMFNVLLAVIVTVVIAILLLIIGYQVTKKSDSVNDEQKCRMSIFANDQLTNINKKAKVSSLKVGFECPRKDVRIEYGDVEKYNRIDDDILKGKIAEEMRSCWSMTGAGKLDPFKASTTVDEKFCMVCSNIIFDEDLVEQAKKEMPRYELIGFQYWIAANKLPGMKSSLYEYIRGQRPDEKLLTELKKSETSPMSIINLDEKYVVLWRVEKYEKGWWEKVGTAVVVGAGVIGAGLLLLPVIIPAAAATGAAASAGSAVATTVGGAAVKMGGAAIGIGTFNLWGDVKMSQQVLVVPEETLSTEFDFEGKGKKTEFCTKLIN